MNLAFRSKMLLLASVFAAVMCPATALQIHVSPNGNDAWYGTLAKPNKSRTNGPLATIAKARDTIRSLKAKGVRGPYEVLIQDGTYYLDTPLVLTPADSGTKQYPITYKAVNLGKAIISGGRPITGWTSDATGTYSAPIREAKGGKWRFRTLRVGDKWAIRARYPNFDPNDKFKGKWLFAKWSGEPWERGIFNCAPMNLHDIGSKLTWRIRVPADGKYRVWLRYSHNMRAFGCEDMSGRSTLTVDDGDPVPLDNLPDTDGWNNYVWTTTAEINLKAGERELVWENVKGGGLSIDAFAITDDYAWNPNESITNFTWWGACTIVRPAEGKNLLIVQGEAADKVQGDAIQMPRPEITCKNDGITFAKGEIPEWKDVKGAEVHVFAAWGWLNGIIPVESIDYSLNRIVFTQPGSWQDIRTGNRYFIENVREALDAPGEWYLDADSGRITCISDAPDGSLALPVVAPRMDRLIVLSGDAKTGKFVEHVNFEGLAFRDCDYNLFDDYYTPQDGALRFEAARDCSVTRCDFRWIGGYALHLSNSSHRITFSGNDVADVGQGGVIMVGSNDTHPHHNVIEGNYIRRIGLIYKHVSGVYCTTGSDNVIAHNTVSDTPRYAISMKSFCPGVTSERNRVEYNDIRRTNLETNDTGAIEMFCADGMPVDQGNLLRYNIIFDSVGVKTDPDGVFHSPYMSWGIYLDNYASGTMVYGNIIARNEWGGVCIHNGRNNTITNNIMVDGNSQQLRLQPWDNGFMRNNRFFRNIVYYSNPAADLIFSYPRQWRPDLFAECNRNVYFLRGGRADDPKRRNTPAGSFDEWRGIGFDTASIIADPLFVDPTKDDYRLKLDSPAFKLGFQRIPVERIGATWWRSRKLSR
jgi:parallel beta-helix repeat protein